MSRPNFADKPKANIDDYRGIILLVLFVIIVFSSGYYVAVQNRKYDAQVLQKKSADDPAISDKIGTVVSIRSGLNVEIQWDGTNRLITFGRSRLVNLEDFAPGDKVTIMWLRHQEDDGHMANYPLITKITN